MQLGTDLLGQILSLQVSRQYGLLSKRVTMSFVSISRRARERLGISMEESPADMG